MIKMIWLFFIALLFFLFSSTPIFAKSDYFLPYPSFMPGSLMYKPHIFLEMGLKYWYFGNFGQFAYNLKQADKYLVEAKTLFEYNQYLLAYRALHKSDSYFLQTLPHLRKAGVEGKNISANRDILSKASQKHIEVLSFLSKEVPEQFVWQPEKSAASVLDLKETIKSSIALRKKYL